MRRSSVPPRPGQRVVSDSEPELGLGTLVSMEGRAVVVYFDGTGEERRYAAGSSPLHRLLFGAGDEIVDADGGRWIVDDVVERDGIAVYQCADQEIPENLLNPRMALGGPRERLLAGRFDAPHLFDLRLRARQATEALRSSPGRGLVGARLELLPHQFFIASEVAGRRLPRVLLADQTGLGKTIEACLILHRLLLTGRAQRALILVPDALVHQWLVELSRRFNLRVALYDEERCAAVQDSEPGANPFDDEQVVLAGWSLLVDRDSRAAEAAEAGWDLVIVDEAHHLGWSRGEPSPEYAAVEQVSASAEGVLLLTATPTQLGEEGHFARLRLLDPDRHTDFDTWKLESEQHRRVADLGEVLIGDAAIAAADLDELVGTLERERDEVAEAVQDRAGRDALLAQLIDRHGPGRAIFSNTRSVLPKLPSREVQLHPLAPAEDDPRLGFLLRRLRETDEKLLVICHSAKTAQSIKAQLEIQTRQPIALFHEDIDLVQRDRNAAWFVEPDGARMMICSEIGSEGRNFQHARRLVMYDLPLDPDLVEQRIGRVDRIGQRHDVAIDVPYLVGTGHEVRARWQHDGVNSLTRHVTVAQPLLEVFENRVQQLAAGWDAGNDSAGDLEDLISETAELTAALESRVESGRDRLLEMSSLRADRAEGVLELVRTHDADVEADEFFLRLLEHFQVIADELGERTYRFDPDGLARVNFSALRQGDVTFTFDREKALLREDYEFATVDHPLFEDALGALLDAETGNASFAVVASEDSPRLLVETVFVLEPVAPPGLHADRYLPPTCIHITVDIGGNPVAGPPEEPGGRGNREWLRAYLPDLRTPLRAAVSAAERMANERAEGVREAANARAETELGGETDRLRALAVSNPNVRPEEVALLELEREELARHIVQARLRLDALKLIWHGPAEKGRPKTG
ncbi:MAG: RNA polymerase-binding ATPase [Acidobacteria bacterium]|nr:RNA polymerase-binding ATPase [Acidobacteriota bacterium]